MIPSILGRLGHDPTRCTTTPVHGGDIHRAFRVESAQGLFFVKTNARPLPAIFQKEARGLEALRQACEPDALIAVPEVLGVDDDFLALGWIESSGRGRGDGGQRLGEGLAALHRHTSPSYGWSEDNWIGSLPQCNDPLPQSKGPGAFFATRRLQTQSRIGEGRLSPSLRARIDRFSERADDLLPLDQEAPALLHGDLWGGNWTVDASGKPWIFDPATHFGCREAELAFTRLFGGFPPRFYDAYEANFPLEPGHVERVDLWNLYPLLVHANLFGGGYGSQAERILEQVVG